MMAALGGMASGLLSKAAKPLLGKAMGGIGNAIGGLFGGGKKKKQ